MNRKVDISFFCRKPLKNYHFSAENFYSELFKKKLEGFNINKKNLPFHSKGIFRRIYNCFWSCINQNEINHISGDINFIAITLNKKNNILTILDLYSLIRLKGIKKKIYKLFWLDIPVMRSNKIITISKRIKKEIIYHTKVDEKKIEVIPCSISNIFKSKRRKINLKKPQILFIGTAPNKNLERSLKALKKLNIELVIIGVLTKKQKILLKNFKIKYRNFINLKINQIYKYYVESDIILYPSTYEGFGLPIIEAQSVGRLVITSKYLRETGAKGAIYVNPYSTIDIRKKILNVMDNRYKNRKIIQLGFKNVKRFDINLVRSKYNKIYKSFYESINSNI